MRIFDYRFLEKSIPANVVNLTAVIADLKTRSEFRHLQYADSFEKLRKRAVIASVKGSNRIEGIVTTDDRIQAIVNGEEPITHDEKEISGYKDALNLIHTHSADLDISEELIRQLHRMIVAGTDPVSAGMYKTRDNYIMEFQPDGTRSIRFRPASAAETPQAMQQLMLAFYEARQSSVIPELILIPCFIVDFLCIHPFLDGNGRVSRLLTVLLLYAAGYDIVRYISLEAGIDKYKESYYTALKDSSMGWMENLNDYTPFVVFFLQILYRCYKELDESFTEITLKKARKSERVEAVLMNTLVPVSKQEIADRLPDVSIKTVELALGRLLKEGKIIKIGTYKDARYMKKETI